MPLAEFLYSRDGMPRKSEQARESGRRLFFAWAEVAAKATWLHRLGIVALLDLHGRIERDFGQRTDLTIAPVVPELIAIPVPTAVPEAVDPTAKPPNLPVAEPELGEQAVE